MSRFLMHWVTVAAALAVAAWILPGVQVSSLPALLVAGLVLGLANAVVRPVLFLLTLPITLLTLGLFYLVLNGFVFGIVALLVPGFAVRSPAWAVAGALIVSIVSWFVGSFARAED